MITESARYQGAVLAHIVDNWDGPITIRRAFDEASGVYVLNEKLPIFIKYTTQRHSPWTFTFHQVHQARQQALYDKLGECLMVFACGRDGIAALSHVDFRNVLDNHFEPQETVTIRRRHAEMYKIRGRYGLKSIGYDVDPLASLLSRVVATRIDGNRVRARSESYRMISSSCSRGQGRKRSLSDAAHRSSPMTTPEPAARRPFGWLCPWHLLRPSTLAVRRTAARRAPRICLPTKP